MEWRKSRRVRSDISLVAALVFVASMLGPSASGHHYEERPLQPGGMIAAFDWSWCTLNLVFEDPAGRLYMGTAAHCTTEVGERMRLHGIGEVGTIVFRDYVTWTTAGDERFKDFALIEIDPDRYDLVDPAGRFWGGPTGVETDFLPMTPTMGYGQGAVFSATEPTRPRVGVLNHGFQDGSNANGDRFEGWFAATHPVQGGDSGGFLMTDEGQAIGVVAWASDPRGEDGYLLGPSFAQILRDLDEAGFDLEVVTAPFLGEDPAALAGAVVDTVGHCTGEPGLGAPTSNACVREPLPWPWDADVRIGGRWADPDEARVSADWTDRVSYYEAFGLAVGTPLGIFGAGTNAFALVPGYSPRDASGVTVTVEDASEDSVFFTVCVHHATAPGHCSEHAAGNVVVSGMNEVTLRTPINAGTWVSAYVYGAFVDMDGTTAMASSGVATFDFEAA